MRKPDAAASGRNLVYVWGYLPGASVEKSPIAAPMSIRLGGGDSWKDVCGGGCGFAMAISGQFLTVSLYSFADFVMISLSGVTIWSASLTFSGSCGLFG